MRRVGESRDWLLPLVSGVVLPFAWPPFSVPVIPFVGLVPLLVWLSEARGPRELFRGGLAFALPYMGGNLWGMAMLARFTLAGVPGFLGILLVQLTTFFLFPVSLQAIRHAGVRAALPLAAPAAWVVSEHARTFGDLAFAWVTLGYAPSGWPSLIQHADLIGVWGISFWLVLVNALAAEAWLRRQRGLGVAVALAGLAVAVVVPLAYGQVRMRQVATQLTGAPTMQVAVVQPNVAQERKWTVDAAEEIFAQLNRQIAEAEASSPDLVVGPEASFPFAISESATRLPEAVASGVRPLLLGAVVGIGAGQPRSAGGLTYQVFSSHHNAAILAAADRRILGRHDKQVLVPVTEQIPYHEVLGFLLPAMRKQFGRFEPEAGLHVLDLPVAGGVARIGTVICYETMFPELVRRLRDLGAEVVINVTNDAWFGRTTFPYQHVGFSVLRAIENRVAVVRAANTGISCVIDPLGRMSGNTALFEKATLIARVPRTASRTPYARVGDVAVLLSYVVVVSLLAAAWVAHRRRRGVLGVKS